MHSNANRKREGIKKCVGCATLLLPWRILAHPTHHDEVICVGGVLLSHNPTIAVPSAQSSLATGIGTGPGVPSTLKPPTQTHKTTTPHTPTGYGQRVASNTVQQTQTQQSFFFLRQTHALSAINLAILVAHTQKVCFLCRCISTSHLQHVTMLTALAYQPHHPWGTSTETSS